MKKLIKIKNTFIILIIFICSCKTGNFNKEATKVIEQIEFFTTITYYRSEAIENRWYNEASLEKVKNEAKDDYDEVVEYGTVIQNLKNNVNFPDGAYDELIGIYTDIKEVRMYVCYHSGGNNDKELFDRYVNNKIYNLHKRSENFRIKYLDTNL